MVHSNKQRKKKNINKKCSDLSQDDECKHVENHVKKVNNAMGNLSLSSFICHIKGHWNNTSLFSTDF